MMIPSKTSFISFFIAICFNIIIFFLLLSVYFGTNPLNNSRSLYIEFVSIFPQGWAFFTKSSKDPRSYLFSCSGEKIELVNLRNFSADYNFGLSRHNRIIVIEMHHLFSKIREDSVKGYVIDTVNPNIIPKILSKNKIVYKKVSIKKELIPDLKGKYLFALQLQLPWSILHKKSNYPLRYKIYPVEIIKK